MIADAEVITQDPNMGNVLKQVPGFRDIMFQTHFLR